MSQLRIVGLIFLVAMFMACKQIPKRNLVPDKDTISLIDSMPFIEFTNPMTDVGRISSGEKVGMDFVFYNRGRQNLIILDAKTSCGCTVPEWDKKPILPGKKGVVRVIYDSSGELGIQNKSIRIISNARKNETDLIISAEVMD